jgi:hypothetical protein
MGFEGGCEDGRERERWGEGKWKFQGKWEDVEKDIAEDS